MQELPFDVEDHVVLKKGLEFPALGNFGASLVFQAKEHGMVREVGPYPRSQVLVEVRGMLLRMNPEHLKLYRRSQHSPRRHQ